MRNSGDNFGDIKIDKSTHRPAADPTILQRIKNGVLAVLMGAVFMQILLFTFRFGSVITLFYFPFYRVVFIVYLAICGILGMIFGEDFIVALRNEGDNWWDLWNYFKF